MYLFHSSGRRVQNICTHVWLSMWPTFIRFRYSQLIITAFNAAIMKLGQCTYEFSLGLSLYGLYFCLKLLVRSDVCFYNKAQVSWVCEFFCVGLKVNYRRFWLLDFSSLFQVFRYLPTLLLTLFSLAPHYLNAWNRVDFSLVHGNLVDGRLAGSLAGVWQIRSGLWKW